MTGRRREPKSARRLSLSPRRPLPKASILPFPQAAPPSVPVITLLTDFGTADYFVAALKGVILSQNPQTQIVDITHEIPPLDVEAGAFMLLTVQQSFAVGTIHVAVVDPGVGSERRPLLITAAGQFFVGPDNGIFSYILERHTDGHVVHLTEERHFRHPVSKTFHGRDIFAPVAAALATGVKPEQLGVRINDPVRLKPLAPERRRDGKIKARVIHVDHFGNCITNISHADLTPQALAAVPKIEIGGKTIRSFRKFFAEPGNDDRLFAIWGSAGFLEIAAKNRSAASLLKVGRGADVIVTAES